MPSAHSKLIVSCPETEKLVEKYGGNRSQVLRDALSRLDWLLESTDLPVLSADDIKALKEAVQAHEARVPVEELPALRLRVPGLAKVSPWKLLAAVDWMESLHRET